ncbi:MAG TPA: DUF58 domain-containing protein [Clostridia bacterium]
MSELFNQEFLKKLSAIAISSRVVLSGGMSGNRKSRSKGSSVEFSDYREYSLGDDFRRIDWNAYGRFDKLFIKLFMEEREAPVTIILDTSKSMMWGQPQKSTASRRLAAALSYMCLANYDRLNIALIGDGISSLKLNMRGKNSFPSILDFLENARYEGVTNIDLSIRQINFSGRGISVIISDLLSGDSIKDVIKYLKLRKQEVMVCQVLSPEEISPDIHESVRLIDSETGEIRDVTVTSSVLKTYKKVFEKFIKEKEGACTGLGASYMMINSDLPTEEMIKMVVERQ